ncbi:MAG: winged helix-turn-helix domain-containing protein [Micromonosporaceae bacterium]|nr:winged helix-turn-helix domain-containing protein [Micromonosporaceae bacterium]
MKVSVLGPLEMAVNGKLVTPSAPKLRNLVALMALRQGHVVTRDTLMEELWGEAPPVSALATLQTYIYQLRRLLGEEPGGGRDTLVTKPLGYLIQLGPDDLDLAVFDRLVEQGRAALAGAPDRAARLLGEALRMCTPNPLSDVDAGPVLGVHISQLAERRLQAIELRVEADLRLGRHREVIGELKTLVAQHPFHEGFSASLMLALERSGRRPEALEAYQALRVTLGEELGIDPSPRLRGMYGALLAVDSQPSQPPPGADHGFEQAGGLEYLGGLVRPAQLPLDIGDFVGRVQLVARLEEMVTGDADGDGGGGTRLVAISGVVGVGKTTLAVRVGHRVRSGYVDGQFYAELSGSSEQPADPHAVLGGFLRAAGLADWQLPQTLGERSQLFRSWTAERRVLVVLDDAATAAQVRPLLPGGTRCAVLVTSRPVLAGLAGVYPVGLAELDEADCLQLLASCAGRQRVAAEPEAAAAVVRMCARSPLGIRAVGARLRANPLYPVRRMAARMADPRTRLALLHVDELDLGARLAPSYRRLEPAARRLLQGLTRAEQGSFTATQAARLTGLPTSAVEPLLDQLAQTAFIRHGDRDERTFLLPGLVRTYVLGMPTPPNADPAASTPAAGAGRRLTRRHAQR